MRNYGNGYTNLIYLEVHTMSYSLLFLLHCLVKPIKCRLYEHVMLAKYLDTLLMTKC